MHYAKYEQRNSAEKNYPSKCLLIYAIPAIDNSIVLAANLD
jgi:hypothetical protein